ncbi:MAG: murein hydrolase activator EnvC family protein [Erysipelotrichaceae bacterium]
MKKALLIIFSILIVATFSLDPKLFASSVKAEDEDFENNYDYYCELCTTKTNLTDAEKEVCIRFKEYEQRRQQELKELLEEAKNNLEQMKANIMQEGQKIEMYNTQISLINQQIESIQSSIVVIEENITTLNLQIEERQLKIDTLNNSIKERMAASQTNVATNSYIKFIMGANSFIDLLRRISAVSEITNYDLDKINQMQQEKQLLEEDLKELQIQKDNLADQQAQLENSKAGLQSLKAITEQLIEEYQKQEAEFLEQMNQLQKDYSELEEKIDLINQAINSLYASKGFGQFFRNTSFWVSTGCYYYASGGFHAAIDLAVNIGTSVYAVANGVVIDTGTGCAYNGGYIGNTCNWGRGNYVFYFVLIGDEYYFIQCDHLKDVNVSIGDVVYQGTSVIGTTGNSGSSTGPHLHLAITYLGNTSSTSPEQIIRNFQLYDNTFGLPYKISSACYLKNSAPCFENPMEIYGYYYPNSYYVGY